MEKRIFRLMGVVFILSYTAWWFMPYTYSYMNLETQSILSYGGYNALLPNSDLTETLWFLLFLGTIITAVGTTFYRKHFRFVYTVLVFVSIVTAPLYGISVETAGGVFLGYISSLSSSALITLSYFSKVKDEFY